MAVDHESLTEEQRRLKSEVVRRFDEAMERFFEDVDTRREALDISEEDAKAIIDHYAGPDVADQWDDWRDDT